LSHEAGVSKRKLLKGVFRRRTNRRRPVKNKNMSSWGGKFRVSVTSGTQARSNGLKGKSLRVEKKLVCGRSGCAGFALHTDWYLPILLSMERF